MELKVNFLQVKGGSGDSAKAYGIQNLSIEGEKLSVDKEAAGSFVVSFSQFIKEKSLSLHQIFNSDETGLYFRLLPDVTLAASFEKTADGRKKIKDCITLSMNACSNASGTIKLPLHMIRNSQQPRCFKGINMHGFLASELLWPKECMDDSQPFS